MGIETLIGIIVLLVVLGLLIWCIQRIPGLPPPVLVAIQIILVLVFALIILNQFGFLGGGHAMIGCR